MNVCFVCWRPYQLMNMLNYIQTVLWKKYDQKDIQMDLFISDLIDPSSIDMCMLRERYFSHISSFREDTGYSPLGKIAMYAFLRHYIKKEAHIEYAIPKYDVIVAAGWHLFFTRLCNLFPKAKVIFLEDGTATYMRDEYGECMQSAYSRVLRFFHRGRLAISISSCYVYNPSMVQVQHRFPVLAMPKPNEQILDECVKLFRFQPVEEYKSYPIIYLTSDDSLKERFSYHENDFLNKLTLFRDKILVRFHPRKEDRNISLVSDQKNPFWELQSGFLNQNSILIAVFSTAQITPYLLFDRKYTLIFLYKMVFPKGNTLYDGCEKWIRLLSEHYDGDIYLPESEEELLDLIAGLTEYMEE